MSDSNKSLKQIIDFRIEKLEKIKSKGIDPFPQKFNPSDFSVDILNNYKLYNDKIVVVAGRIISLRIMGSASFFNIQDNKGRVQIFLLPTFPH